MSLVLAAILAATSPGAESTRAWLAEIALEGPIGGVVLDVGASGDTRLSGALMTGETRHLVVPLPARSAAERIAPKIEVTPLDPTAAEHGVARFVRWVEPTAPDFSAVPPGVRARARPPVARGVVRPSAAALLAIGALGALVLGLARRGRLAFVVAGIGAAGVASLEPLRVSAFEPHVTILEGDPGSALWLEVEGAADRLAVRAPLADSWIEAVPANARLSWRGRVEDAEALEVSGVDVELYRVALFEPGHRRIDRSSNGFAPIDAAWLRDGGEWRGHGSWPLGAPLPPALAGDAGGPPGWLASGLPQGPCILIARLERESGPGSVYLRLVSFD